MVKAITGNEGGFITIHVIYSNLPVARSEVKRGKEGGSTETVKCVVNTWKRVHVFFGDFVDMPIINAEPQGAVFLLY